jgi:tetratricopeptide (TPR) repeat protein
MYDKNDLQFELEIQLNEVDIQEKKLAPDHPDQANSYNNLARIYRALGELEKALEYQMKVLKIKEKILPPDDPDLANSYNNLAMIYRDLSKLDKALENQLKALDIQKKILPPDHPDLADSYNNLALIYQYLKGPELRGTLSGIFVVGAIITILALSTVGYFGFIEIKLGLLLMPGIITGFFISKYTAKILDRGFIRPAILTFSMLSGIILLFKTLL